MKVRDLGTIALRSINKENRFLRITSWIQQTEGKDFASSTELTQINNLLTKIEKIISKSESDNNFQLAIIARNAMKKETRQGKITAWLDQIKKQPDLRNLPVIKTNQLVGKILEIIDRLAKEQERIFAESRPLPSQERREHGEKMIRRVDCANDGFIDDGQGTY